MSKTVKIKKTNSILFNAAQKLSVNQVKASEQLLYKIIIKEKLFNSNSINELIREIGSSSDRSWNGHAKGGGGGDDWDLLNTSCCNLEYFLKDKNYFLKYFLTKLILDRCDNYESFACVFEILLSLTFNLIKTPWRDEYRKIRKYSGQMSNVLNIMPKFLFKLKELGFNTDSNEYIEYTMATTTTTTPNSNNNNNNTTTSSTLNSNTSNTMTSSTITANLNPYSQQQQLNDFFYDCYLIYHLFTKILNFTRITLSMQLKQVCTQPYLILDYFVNEVNDLNEYNEANLLNYLKSKRCLVKIEQPQQQQNTFLNTIDSLPSHHGGIYDYRYDASTVSGANALSDDLNDDFEILSNQQWTCNKCTFLNDSDLRYCAMCKAHKLLNAFLD